MSNKIKKYILVIPTLFVMLLNCLSFTVYAENTTEAPTEIDYQSYYLDPEETIPEVLAALDFRKIENFPKLTIPEKYAFLVYAEIDNYNKYLSGTSKLELKIQLFDLTDAEYNSNYYYMLTTEEISYKNATYKFDSSGLDSAGTFYLNNSRAIYSFESEYFGSTSRSTMIDETVYNSSRYRFYFETNVEEFGYTGGALNVEVNFDPEMSGDFQRREIINDKIVTIDTLNFSVTNNSKFSIQYLVAIVSQDDFFSLYSDNAISHPNGKVYSGDPTYVYVSDEWCYLPSGTKGITSTYCPSSWHHVDSGDVDKVTVKFNQMKLNVGVIYNVYVYAVKNTQDSVCVIPFNQDSYQYNEDYVLNFAEAQVVYSSQFTCSNPAEFDPDSNSGSYAFDGSDTSFFNRANGYIDENGNVVIDRIDTDSLISGSDSWGSQFDKNAWDVYYDRQNSVSSDLSQLSNNFSSFFRFVNKIFGYFPKNYQSVCSLGLVSIVVLGIIKVVIK